MAEEYLQIAARAPRGRGDPEQLRMALESEFGLDLSSELDAFCNEGAFVCHAETMAEARATAGKIQRLGCDVLILDGLGKTLKELKGSTFPLPGTQQARLDSTTLGLGISRPVPPSSSLDISLADEGISLNGDPQSGGLQLESDTLDKTAAATPSKMREAGLEPESVALGETAAAPPSGALDIGLQLNDPGLSLEAEAVAETALSAPPSMPGGPDLAGLASDGDGATGALGPADPVQGGGFSLDALNVDSLVMLDGSSDGDEEYDPEGLSLESPVTSHEDFGPSAHEDEALELDDGFKPHGEGVGKDGGGPIETEGEDEPESEDVEWIPAGEGAAGQPPAPEQQAAAEQAPDDPIKRVPSVPQPGTTAIRGGHRGSPLFILAGYFSDRIKLRIVIGFMLALGLGYIGPTCYANSVKEARIRPLLVDLSTAKAHGHLMRGLPSYRTVEDINAQISGIKSRYGMYSFVMWLAIAGVIGFVWFHFTRWD